MDGLHFRQGHRERRKSLTDRVPVERIAALDRQEPFERATLDLNNEIRAQDEERAHQE
jgi:glycerol-3-phosphate O-acyltransferase / dihydroxyacetone phosphate acyltransferase